MKMGLFLLFILVSLIFGIQVRKKFNSQYKKCYDACYFSCASVNITNCMTYCMNKFCWKIKNNNITINK